VKPDKAVGEQLDWYQNVNRKGSEPIPGLKQPAHSETKGAANQPDTATAPAALPAAKPHAAGASKSTLEQGKVTYSVQVGAFRYKQEAEAKAELLKEKRYQYAIEQFGGPGGLYLLKVGKYDSRADAVAMQLRLKKDGFGSFIKTTK
jgi:cell division protein FtsN